MSHVLGVRVGKALPPGTFVIYVGCEIKDIVTNSTESEATKWGKEHFGGMAYSRSHVQALEINFNR